MDNRNPMATVVRSPLYRKRVVANRKKYDRKRNAQESARCVEEVRKEEGPHW